MVKKKLDIISMPRSETLPHTWDKALSYEEVFGILKDAYIKLKNKIKSVRQKHKITQLLYLTLAIIQLSNGCRSREAINFLWNVVLHFENNDYELKREFYIKVEKQKNPNYRLMILPQIVDITTINLISEKLKNYMLLGKDKLLSVNYTCWLKKNLGFSSHALRYAFITKMARDGKPAQLIAKITGHRKLDHILHYVSKVQAENELKHFMSKNI